MADLLITVASLRRFPVKSMGGEDLEWVELDAHGLHGDRRYAVRDHDGRLASGKNTRRFRRRDAIFEYSASTTMDGVLVTGARGGRWDVGDAALAAELSAAMNTSVEVTASTAESFQDRGSVSLISDASLRWCAQRWGDADPRRLRSNLILAGGEAFSEERWLGHELRIGEARLRVVERIPRCRMIDVAQDAFVPDVPWLIELTRIRQMYLGVYAEVLVPGILRKGDRLTVC